MTNASRDTSLLNHTGKFFTNQNEANNRSTFTDPGNTSLTPIPQTGKRTNMSSIMSSNQTMESSEITMKSQTTQYMNTM